MSAFLSATWFEELNQRLTSSLPAPLAPDAAPCRVVFEVTDAPAGGSTALTLLISGPTATVAPSSRDDHALADVVLRLNYEDADALTHGRLDSATALRQGRIKVRGDVNLLVPWATWLVDLLSG